jgi:predicted nucleic acid-binding protein
MIFTDLSAGQAVFLDANTFVYHYQPHSVFGPPCTELIERIGRRELMGFTSGHVVAEMAHRLMSVEACQLYNWPFPGIVGRMRKNLSQMQALLKCRDAIQEIPKYGIQVLPLLADHLDAAAALIQQIGLLVNDALIVAVMQAHGLINIASHDADFDRVPGISRFAPV